MKTVAVFLAVFVLVLATPLGVSQTTTDAGLDSDLDLREANVVGVESQATGDGGYTFDVTLYHDDDGEDGYANWWQVETLNGTELSRRELLHAHGTEPFTRSTLVEVPENVSLVVVRGHDQTHGYGGQAMVVDLQTGATDPVQQGREQRNFSDCTVLGGAADSGSSTNHDDSTIRDNLTPSNNSTNLVRCPWESNETASESATNETAASVTTN